MFTCQIQWIRLLVELKFKKFVLSWFPIWWPQPLREDDTTGARMDRKGYCLLSDILLYVDFRCDMEDSYFWMRNMGESYEIVFRC